MSVFDGHWVIQYSAKSSRRRDPTMTSVTRITDTPSADTQAPEALKMALMWHQCVYETMGHRPVMDTFDRKRHPHRHNPDTYSAKSAFLPKGL